MVASVPWCTYIATSRSRLTGKLVGFQLLPVAEDMMNFLGESAMVSEVPQCYSYEQTDLRYITDTLVRGFMDGPI